MRKFVTVYGVVVAAVVVAVATLGVAPTPDYSGITAEAGNQLSSAPTLVAGLIGPVMGLVMLIAGAGLAFRWVRRGTKG